MAEKEKLTEEKIIEDWELLFPSPNEAKTVKGAATQLLKAGLGKRDKETDLMFMLRVQYCLATDVPLSMINQTYMVYGAIHEMVDLKRWRLKKAFPQAEIITIMASNDRVVKKGRLTPNDNWIKVEWTVEKAKLLITGMGKKAHWNHNSISMLNARCDGQLCDLLGGFATAGVGYMSTEEINNLGVELKE